MLPITTTKKRKSVCDCEDRWKLRYEDEFEMRKKRKSGDCKKRESNVRWCSNPLFNMERFQQLDLKGRENPANCWSLLNSLRKYTRVKTKLRSRTWTRAFAWIPERVLEQNPAMCALGIEYGVPLRNIPALHRTLENCHVAVQFGREEDLFNVPSWMVARATDDQQFRLQLQHLYECAVKANGKSLRYVPPHLQTHTIALLAMKNTTVAVDYVEDQYKTREACNVWVKHKDWRPSEETFTAFPENAWTPALCNYVLAKFALDRKNLCCKFPVHLVEAAALYAVQQQNHDEYRWLQLLPEIHITHPQHVTKKMWLAFVLAHDLEPMRRRLAHVPYSYRTRSIWYAAVGVRGIELVHVPFEKRTRALCKLALKSLELQGDSMQPDDTRDVWKAIPPENITSTLLQIAMRTPKLAREIFPLLPMVSRTHARCLAAVAADPTLFKRKTLIRSEMENEETALEAVALPLNHSSIPQNLLSNPSWLKRAIERHPDHALIMKLFKHVPESVLHSHQHVFAPLTRQLLKEKFLSASESTKNNIWQDLFSGDAQAHAHREEATLLLLRMCVTGFTRFCYFPLVTEDLVVADLCALSCRSRGTAAAETWRVRVPQSMRTKSLVERWCKTNPAGLVYASMISKNLPSDPLACTLPASWLTPQLCLSALRLAVIWNFRCRGENASYFLSAETAKQEKPLFQVFLSPPWMILDHDVDTLKTADDKLYADWQSMWTSIRHQHRDFNAEWIQGALLPSVPPVWRADVCLAWHSWLFLKYGPKHPFLKCHVPGCREKCLKRIRHVFSALSFLSGLCSDSVMLTLQFL